MNLAANLKGSIEPSAPVADRQKMAEKWSGREDSNLRPLPPEDNYRALIRLFSVHFNRGSVRFSAVCSRSFHIQKGSEVQVVPPTPVFQRTQKTPHD